MRIFGGNGQPLSTYGQPNYVALQAGECYYFNSNVNPSVPGQGTGNAGWLSAKLGRYCAWQVYDPIALIWRGIGDDSNAQRFLQTDGVNYRIANQSGCAVAAVVTTAGSAYVTPPTVVASAGGSTWTAVLGPGVTSITVNYGGSNYTYPPAVVIAPPPAGGVCATAYATLSGTAVSSITVVDTGAGYSAGVPGVVLVNDPRDTTGSGATATATLSGSGTVLAVVCTNHGSPITSGTVPTLTFGSGSAAATVLMNWGVQTYSVTTAGAGYGNSSYVILTAAGPAAPSPTGTNPNIQQNLVRLRNANIWVPTNSTGGLTSGGEIIDGGVYFGIPNAVVGSVNGAAPSTAGVLALTMGGFTDSVLLQPA